MEAKKIQKGWYQADTRFGKVQIMNMGNDVEGPNKWLIWSNDLVVANFIDDELWNTKSEALEMIQFFIR